MEKLIYLPVSTHQIGERVKAHIGNPDGTPLCASKKPVRKGMEITSWDNFHYENPYGSICEICKKKAEMIFRPKAKFWYLDPFNGDIKEFGSLRRAVVSAKQEHGSSTIWQLGPGNINKIIETVKGLDPLP